MGNIAGGKRGDVSRCRLCLGRRHVTYSWMKEWVIAGWAFLSTPLLKQKFTIVPAHKKKKRMNPPTLGRFILEPGGVKSNRNWAFHRIARIKWETVCLPKEQGGLGLEDINTFNLALLDKWK